MTTNPRQYSLIDRAITHVDHLIRHFSHSEAAPSAAYPAEPFQEQPLSKKEKRHIASLMRINHTGEVCAQALYLGQSLTARDVNISAKLKQAAQEETAHLQWCAKRLKELDARTSYLNPAWFIGSLSIGLFAGMIGDHVSLGFLHETENQVVRHLTSHLQQIPSNDHRTRAILEQMKTDEAQHASLALQQGAMIFPNWIKTTMQLSSKVMTSITYYC